MHFITITITLITITTTTTVTCFLAIIIKERETREEEEEEGRRETAGPLKYIPNTPPLMCLEKPSQSVSHTRGDAEKEHPLSASERIGKQENVSLRIHLNCSRQPSFFGGGGEDMAVVVVVMVVVVVVVVVYY